MLVCIGFVFFRSNTVHQAVHMLISFFDLKTNISITSLGLDKHELLVAGISLMLLFVTSLIKQKANIREFISKRNIILRFTIWIGLVVIILVFGYYGEGYDSQAFIYQKF